MLEVVTGGLVMEVDKVADMVAYNKNIDIEIDINMEI